MTLTDSTSDEAEATLPFPRIGLVFGQNCAIAVETLMPTSKFQQDLLGSDIVVAHLQPKSYIALLGPATEDNIAHIAGYLARDTSYAQIQTTMRTDKLQGEFVIGALRSAARTAIAVQGHRDAVRGDNWTERIVTIALDEATATLSGAQQYFRGAFPKARLYRYDSRTGKLEAELKPRNYTPGPMVYAGNPSDDPR